MTRTPLSRSKGQRSRSPGRFTHPGVNASGSCSCERGNVLSVGTYCYVAVCRLGRLGGARRFGARRGRRGAGAYSGGRSPAYILYLLLWKQFMLLVVRAIADRLGCNSRLLRPEPVFVIIVFSIQWDIGLLFAMKLAASMTPNC